MTALLAFPSADPGRAQLVAAGLFFLFVAAHQLRQLLRARRR